MTSCHKERKRGIAKAKKTLKKATGKQGRTSLIYRHIIFKYTQYKNLAHRRISKTLYESTRQPHMSEQFFIEGTVTI